MESLYKKKGLKFSGFHKEVKKSELKLSREVSRQKRLSTLRDLGNCSFNTGSRENINEKLNNEKKRCIPSRTEMLKKWKEEKAMKQQKELEKKSVVIVKPGFCLKKPAPRAPEIKNRTDDFNLNEKMLPNSAHRSNSKSIKPPPVVLKSTTQPIKTSTVPKKPAVTVKSTSNIKPQVPQRTAGSKSLLTPKSTIPKSGPSTFSLRTSALQGKPAPKEIKPTAQKVTNPTKTYPQSSKVTTAPVTNTRVIAKTVTLPKASQKLPLAKSKQEKDIRSTNVASSDKTSKIAFPNRFREPSNRIASKITHTTKDNQKKCTEVKEQKVKPKEIFSCDISTIEPSISRKSFAPHNFLFCPPSEWSFPFEIDVTSPAFSRLRCNGEQRTSSPIKISEQNLKSSTDESSNTEKKATIHNGSYHETNLEEKNKTSLSDSECLNSKPNSSNVKTEGSEMRADISEMKMESEVVITVENCNSSVSGLITSVDQKTPLTSINDSNSGDIEKFCEKITEVKVAQSPLVNIEPTLVVAGSNDVSQSCSEILQEKLINIESVDAISSLKLTDIGATENASMPLVPIDNSLQNNTENCTNWCFPNSSKNSEQNKFLEPAKCSTFETFEDSKLINFESSCKPIENGVSQNVSTMLVPIDNISQNNAEDCLDSCFPSTSENPEQEKFFNPLKHATLERPEDNNKKLINIKSSYLPTENSATQNVSSIVIKTDTLSTNNAEDCPNSYFSSSSENPELKEIFKSVKCASSEMLSENKLIDFESPYKSIDNDACGDNTKNFLEPDYNNADNCPFSDITIPGQDKSSKTENCINLQTLVDDTHFKSSDSVFSSSATQNGLDGCLTEVESHVDPCSSSLTESLKTFNLAASLTEKAMGKVSTRQRKSKMPPRYTLASINESMESKGTPCVTPKSAKKLLSEENFTPRRSARLSEKLNKSGSLESFLNIEKPKMMNSLDFDDLQLKTVAPITKGNTGTPVSCKKKSKVDKDFTPRRSQRLSEMLRRSSSFESLFDVRRPSIMGSPCMDEFLLEGASGITYDFDNLALEDSPKIIKGAKGPISQVSKKVSLLYTPPGKKSILRQSIRADLMSFSPS